MRTITSPRQVPERPTDILFGDYHRRLLPVLLLRPDQDFHLREIERRSGVPAGSAHRELGRFVRAGLLSQTRVGNQVRYRADTTCPIYAELAGILRKTFGFADVLRKALEPLAPRIDTAFVFGSVARGEEGAFSDVDLMVVGSVTLEDVVEAVHGSREQLGREINPVVMTIERFHAKRVEKDRFVTRVLSEPRIMLTGEIDEPRKPAQDRPVESAPARRRGNRKAAGGRRA